MDVLADENVESEWVAALLDGGHDVERVVDLDELGVSAPDAAVLAVASDADRVLVTADQSDFSDPPADDHAGVVVITDGTISGGELCSAIQRIERSYPESSGFVTYVSDWL